MFCHIYNDLLNCQRLYSNILFHIFQDVFDDYASPTTAAQILLCTAAKKRKEVRLIILSKYDGFLNGQIVVVCLFFNSSC